MLRKSPNGHLHLAMAMALAASAVIALAIPISRTTASPFFAPQSASATDALSTALSKQAQTVTEALASPAAVSESRFDAGIAADLIPQPLLVAAARVAAGGLVNGTDAQSLMLATRENPVGFTLHENGFVSHQVTSYMSVRGALAELGIEVATHDRIWPPLDSDLTAGSHVYVYYATKVTLVVEGEHRTVHTHASTVAELLQERGIRVEASDTLSPLGDKPVREDMLVTLITVRDLQEVQERPVEFDTVYVFDNSLPDGEYLLDQAGVNGTIRREYIVRKVNGNEINRTLVSEEYTPPTEQVVLVGTYVPPAPQPTPAPAPPPVVSVPDGPLQCAKTMHVWATWYTAASAGGSGITFTGTPVYKGIVAVDPTVIPLGTEMYIPGYGYGLAADTGGGVKGNFIDLGYGPNDVYDWKTGYVDICILP